MNGGGVMGALWASDVASSRAEFERVLSRKGAVLNGTTDDSGALQEALNEFQTVGYIAPIMFPSGIPKIRIDSGIVVPISVQRVDFGGIEIDASNMSSGAAITLNATGATQETYRQAIAGVDNLQLIGPGEGSSVVGVDWVATPAGSSTRASMINSYLKSFGTGHRFGDRGYATQFYNMSINDCGVGIDHRTGSDAGENIGIHGGLIFNGGTAIVMSDDTAEINCHSVSFDYNTKVIDQNSGILCLTSCHIEGNSTADDQIDIDGNGSHFHMVGGLITWTGSFPSSYAQFGNVRHAASVATFNSVRMHNLGNTNERLFTGPGRVIVKDSVLLSTANMPARISDNVKDSAINGTFEDATYPLPFFAYCGGATNYTNRLSGTGITVARSTGQFASGSASLVFTKTSGSPAVVMFIPVTQGEIISVRYADLNPDSVSGTYNLDFHWYSTGRDENGLALTEYRETIGGTVRTPTTSWTYRNERPFGDRKAPAWATHLRLTFFFGSYGNGTMFIDDLYVSKW